MSVTGKNEVGIPTLLFHDGEGLSLAVETRDGTLYKGRCDLTEDTFNMSMYHCMAYFPDGTERRMERAYIRGSQIVFIVFPEILSQAPYFERVRRAASGRTVAIGLGTLRLAAIQKNLQERRFIESLSGADGSGVGGGGGGGRGGFGGRGGRGGGGGFRFGGQSSTPSGFPAMPGGRGGGGNMGASVAGGVGGVGVGAQRWANASSMPPQSAPLGFVPGLYQGGAPSLGPAGVGRGLASIQPAWRKS